MFRWSMSEKRGDSKVNLYNNYMQNMRGFAILTMHGFSISKDLQYLLVINIKSHDKLYFYIILILTLKICLSNTEAVTPYTTHILYRLGMLKPHGKCTYQSSLSNLRNTESL